ncbi:NACHT domain-containing protein [Streptomyces sp. NPDC028722]|uniref:NACHT domain-containing protein n=1 Tax=Streptomyces sp. NPDC028722 TaxID=3155016 RepID=UPI0033F85E84
MNQYVMPEDPLSGPLEHIRTAVHLNEGAERTRLLKDVVCVDISYTLRPEPGRGARGAEARGRLTSNGEGVRDIAAYYRDLTPGRLVITGAPGAGKTVLALELITALTRHEARGQSVPVRLSAAAWDTAVPLDRHLAEHLTTVFEIPGAVAQRLVDRRLIVPVIDGLDEMDPLRPDGTADPRAPRAVAVIDALNAYQNGPEFAAVILTCRTEHFRALREPDGPGRRQLLDSAGIEIDPVETADAIAYLCRRAKDPTRWQPVLKELAETPRGTLATALFTPWRLCLAATVFFVEGDPAELLRPRSPAELDSYLLARYLPAVVRQRDDSRYPVGQVHRWLHHIAAYLEHPAPWQRPPLKKDRPESSGVDIDPYRLWPMAGWVRVRTWDGKVPMLTVPWALLALVGAPPRWSDAGLVQIVMLISLAFSMYICTVYEPGRLVRLGWNRHAAPYERRLRLWSIVLGVVGGMGGGIALAWDHALLPGIGIAVVLTANTVLLSLLSLPLMSVPSPAARPRRLIPGDVGYRLLQAVAHGGALGGAFTVMMGFRVGIGFTLAYGLGAGGLLSGGAVRRYLVFVCLARYDRLLPLRLGPFLDWALEAGLLRLSGPAYQFRHRELQQWLAAHPEPAEAARVQGS